MKSVYILLVLLISLVCVQSTGTEAADATAKPQQVEATGQSGGAAKEENTPDEPVQDEPVKDEPVEAEKAEEPVRKAIDEFTYQELKEALRKKKLERKAKALEVGGWISDQKLKKLMVRFHTLDVNNDGVIDNTDFDALMANLGITEPVEEKKKDKKAQQVGGAEAETEPQPTFNWRNARKSFFKNVKKADSIPKDKIITEAEYVAYYTNTNPIKIEKDIKNGKAGLAMLDADFDMQLSKEEFVKFVATGSGIAAEDAEQMWSDMDTDSDGFLSAEEQDVAVTNFWTSDDLTVAGTTLWGPIPADEEAVTDDTPEE